MLMPKANDGCHLPLQESLNQRLSGGVATIGKDGLPGNPPAIRN